MRILVVEDENPVAAFMKKGLEEEAHAVDTSSTGPEGERLARANPYDLIVLDLMLPGKDGLDVCRDLRNAGLTVPILMLSARDTFEDKVLGLDSGADDYLTKPFAFEEFLARIRALSRRNPNSDAPPSKVGDLVLDRIARKAWRGEREIALTNREFALLSLLMRRSGQVVSRAVLAEGVWGLGLDPESNLIDVTMNHLRNKIDRGPETRLIQTIRGSGYVLREGREVIA